MKSAARVPDLHIYCDGQEVVFDSRFTLKYGWKHTVDHGSLQLWQLSSDEYGMIRDSIPVEFAVSSDRYCYEGVLTEIVSQTFATNACDGATVDVELKVQELTTKQ